MYEVFDDIFFQILLSYFLLLCLDYFVWVTKFYLKILFLDSKLFKIL